MNIIAIQWLVSNSNEQINYKYCIPTKSLNNQYSNSPQILGLVASKELLKHLMP